MKILLENRDDVDVVVCYGGRFQPVTPNHIKVLHHLYDEFGKDATIYVQTSNSVKPPKSPFNFEEKKRMWQIVAGVTPIEEMSAYTHQYLLTNLYDRDNTVLIRVMGEKDAGRIQNGYTGSVKNIKINSAADIYDSEGVYSAEDAYYFYEISDDESEMKYYEGQKVCGTLVREKLKEYFAIGKEKVMEFLKFLYDDNGFKKITKAEYEELYNIFKSKFGTEADVMGESFLMEAPSMGSHLFHCAQLPLIENGVGLDALRKAVGLFMVADKKSEGEEKIDLMIQRKIDGSPSTFIGIDPENGKFFVSTKRLLNKVPVAYYSVEDIEKNITIPRLKEILIEVFNTYKNVKGFPDGVICVRGDFMFDESSKKAVEDAISVIPNTVEYVSTSDRIKNAKIGMAWHTCYTGDSLDTIETAPDFPIADWLDKFVDPNEVYNMHNTVRNDSLDLPGIGRSKTSDFKKLMKNVDKMIELGVKLDRKTSQKLLRIFDNVNRREGGFVNEKNAEKWAEENIKVFSPVDQTEDSLDYLILYYIVACEITNLSDYIVESLDKCGNDFVTKINGKETTGEGYVFSIDGILFKIVPHNFTISNMMSHMQTTEEYTKKDIWHMIIENQRNNRHVIIEGGNIHLKTGEAAEKIRIANMDEEKFDNFRKDILQAFHAMNKDFEKFSGEPLWRNEKATFKRGKVFSGSTRLFFSIDYEEFVKYKKVVGDQDIKVPKELFEDIGNWLDESRGKMFGVFEFVGYVRSGTEINTLLKSPKEYSDYSKYIQVDLEPAEFEGTDVSDRYQLLTYSSWEDMQNGVKGAIRDIIWRRLTNMGEVKKFVLVNKKGKPVDVLNQSLYIYSRKAVGIVQKFVPYLDEDGKQVYINNLPAYTKVPNTEYVSATNDLDDMFKFVFGHKPVGKEKTAIYSYIRTLKTVKEEWSEEKINELFERFVLGDLYKVPLLSRKEEDIPVKDAAYKKWLEIFPEFKKRDAEVQKAREEYMKLFKK